MNKCKWLGHTVSFYDSGYPTCDRCGSHGYYNSEEWENGWHYFPIRILWWVTYQWQHDIPSKIEMLKFRYRLWMMDDNEIPF